MAVDWAAYRLAPDFSGLAQGIQQYGANKRQSEQFAQEMDYKNRALAAEQQRASQSGGGLQAYADLFKDENENYFRVSQDAQGMPVVVPMTPGTQLTGKLTPTTAGVMGQIGATQDLGYLEYLKEQQRQKAKEEAAAAAGTPAAERERLKAEAAAEGKGKGEAKVASTVELEKKLGTENATYFSTLQDEAAQAIDEIPNLEATLAFSKDPNVVQGLGAKQRAFVQKVFSDPVATEKYYTSLSRMATAVLNAQTGTKTENDALRAALDNAQATNTPEANQYLLELLVAQKKKAITKARDANRLYNEGKFTKGNFLEQWGAKNETPQAPQGAPQAQPNAINVGKYQIEVSE